MHADFGRKHAFSNISGCTIGPEVKALLSLNTSNLDSNAWPWNRVADGKKKKWVGLIPVKTNGVVRAEGALNRMEKRLGKQIFDRTSIANMPDDDIRRGVVVSERTASSPNPGPDNCGYVGAGPNRHDYPKNFLKPSGEIDTVLYVNLGSEYCDDSKCGKSESDIAVHEFGHAMELGPHFKGFGEGPIISEDFWRVLELLYADE
jgi:hypothetical protein